MLKRQNSGNWRQEINKNVPLSITLILPDGTVVPESISKFDMLIPTLCEKHRLFPENYKLVDVQKPEIKFTKASSLADFEGNPYTAEDFEDLTLKLSKRTMMNKMLGKGRSRRVKKIRATRRRTV